MISMSMDMDMSNSINMMGDRGNGRREDGRTEDRCGEKETGLRKWVRSRRSSRQSKVECGETARRKEVTTSYDATVRTMGHLNFLRPRMRPISKGR
jgi:hypothetical protein